MESGSITPELLKSMESGSITPKPYKIIKDIMLEPKYYRKYIKPTIKIIALAIHELLNDYIWLRTEEHEPIHVLEIFNCYILRILNVAEYRWNTFIEDNNMLKADIICHKLFEAYKIY